MSHDKRKLADKYARTLNEHPGFVGTVGYEAVTQNFFAGWDACLESLKEAAPAFDEKTSIKEFEKQTGYNWRTDALFELWNKGARWQYEKDKAMLAVKDSLVQSAREERDQAIRMRDELQERYYSRQDEHLSEIASLNAKLDEALRSSVNIKDDFQSSKVNTNIGEGNKEDAKDAAIAQANQRIAELEAALGKYPCQCNTYLDEVKQAHPQLECFRCKTLRGSHE